MSVYFPVPGNRSIEIVHKEIQPEWEEVTIELDKDEAEYLDEIGEMLSKHGLTVNDFLIAVIEDAADNPEVYKKEM